MFIYRDYGATGTENFTGQDIHFLDLNLGEFCDFMSVKRLSVTTDNFRGWVKTKPHTTLRYDFDKENQKWVTQEAVSECD